VMLPLVVEFCAPLGVEVFDPQLEHEEQVF